MTEPAEDLGLISGRYRLGELLGTGGSASVFEAVDVLVPGAPSLVALKILHPHLSQSEGAREAFFVEAWAASTLRHPNIAGVLGVGVHDSSGEKRAWIAMQRAEGTSLAEFVETHGPLTVTQALELADAVLKALEAAHAQGLVHRDISPANIMLAVQEESEQTDQSANDDGPTRADDVGQPAGPQEGQHVSPAAPRESGARLRSVQVVDFGLADAAGRPALGFDILRSTTGSAVTSRAEQGVLGSANYMAPEQALGLAVDERSDLYQLGAVLYFAVTGQPPFIRDSTSSVMRAHVTAPPPIASVARPGLDRRFDRMISRVMLKDPAVRPQSAAAFRRQVVEIQAALDPNRTAERVSSNAVTDRVPELRPAATTTVRLPLTAHTPETARLSAVTPRTPAAPAPQAVRAPLTSPAPPAPPVRTRARSGGAIWLAAILTATVIAVVWVLGSNASSSSSIAAPTPMATGRPGSSPSPIPSATSGSPTPAVPSPTATSQPVVPSASAVASPTVSPAPDSTLVSVPPLPGMTLADARLSAQAFGLTIGAVTPQDSAAPAGTVLSSDPAAGTRAPVGSSVSLTVASGSTVVPPLVALSQQEAVAAVQAAGLSVMVTNLPSSSRPAGTVASTNPAVGARVAVGSTVTIAVAQPAAPPTPSVTPSAPPPTPSPTAER